MSKAQAFTQTQVQRLIRAIKSEGMEPSSIEIDKDGKLVARFGGGQTKAVAKSFVELAGSEG